MRCPKGRKQYVEVLATHRIDGTVRPQQITMAAGPTFEIEEADTPRQTNLYLTGEMAKQYPVTIREKKTFLYEDAGRWWVMLKEEG